MLLRPSGTEPLVRVMVEASELETAQSIAATLAEVVRERSPRAVSRVPPRELAIAQSVAASLAEVVRERLALTPTP